MKRTSARYTEEGGEERRREERGNVQILPSLRERERERATGSPKG